jgi:hypothetical protein
MLPCLNPNNPEGHAAQKPTSRIPILSHWRSTVPIIGNAMFTAKVYERIGEIDKGAEGTG